MDGAGKIAASNKIDNLYFDLYCNLISVRHESIHTVTANNRIYKMSSKPMYSVANLLPTPLYVGVEKALKPGLIVPPGGSASICDASIRENQLPFSLEK